MAGLLGHATTRNRRSSIPPCRAVSKPNQAEDAAEPLLPDHPLELLFADHRHAQLPGLIELAPRLRARQHIIGLLTDTATCPPAIFLNRRLNLLAAEVLECPSD